MPQAYAATSSYSCVSGGTLYGSTCLRTTVYAATPAYNCPSGGSPSGSTCTQTSSYAATPVYSCNNGAALNGSTCTQTNTSAATAAYRCPHGGTLSGSQCTGAYTIKTAYIYLNGKQIAETVIDGATRFVHTDALGSPVAHTNAAGAELNRTKYEPYGYTAAGTKPGVAAAGLATTGSAIGFTGHVNDPETDLVYMQQRYYDPVAGRFLSIDPVVTDANTGGSFNRYAYAINNPYKYVDPDGRNPLLKKLVDVLVRVLVKTEQQAAKNAANEVTKESAKATTKEAAKVEAKEAAKETGKEFSKEKQSLVEMANGDKKTGITPGDMKAYKDLNKELPDPFPSNKVRGPEAHSSGAPSSQSPHGHVGPVNHIPVREL